PISGNKWNIPHTSRWIRNILIKFPGVMYDSLYASAKLGITLESFSQERVMNLFSDSLYMGPFSSQSHPHWWNDPFIRKAMQLTLAHDLRGPIHKTFRDAIYKEYDIELEPSRCIYDNSTYANYVCYIYREPVQASNSLPYYPDNRPSGMEPARVSFRAIRESNKFDELLVADSDLPTVERLWDEA
ncbi:MAG: hypothetical protein K8L99_06040, partial [Anaerolineae bacterium]|nr:hypothetical protein [Anaerolineae bacterium]